MNNNSYSALCRTHGPALTSYIRILLTRVDEVNVAHMYFMRRQESSTNLVGVGVGVGVAIALRKRCMDEK